MVSRVLSVLCVLGGWEAVARPGPRRFRDVPTTQGVARGYFVSHLPHYAFTGIPYAAPTRPRFQTAEPPPHWDGIFEATHHVKCPQDGEGDENCLVVNVFSPEDAAALPVLVFVHGGQFQHGWGSYKPPAKLLSQGLVIVTFNYRLGILGFLCLRTGAGGNIGLKDQIAALYWVQRNIANFGGDPLNVTVYGVGSGATSVQMLLLSGLTNGLLHKVILESGSVLSPTSLTYEPPALALNTAKKLGYKHSDDNEELLKFFQKTPLRQLTNTSEIFLPCVESSYYYVHNLLVEDPIDTLKKGFQEVPMVLAYTSTDGMNIIEKNIEAFNYVPEQFASQLPSNLRIEDKQNRIRIAELVKEFYFDGLDGHAAKKYADYFNDVLFAYPIMKFGVMYAMKSSQSVYMLKFLYKSVRKNVLKKTHMIDYVYGDELLEEDNLVADRLITLLCNFIKLGDPTPITTSMIPIIWKPLYEGSDEMLGVTTAPVLQLAETVTMTTTRGNQRLSFWDHVYDNFYRKH